MLYGRAAGFYRFNITFYISTSRCVNKDYQPLGVQLSDCRNRPLYATRTPTTPSVLSASAIIYKVVLQSYNF